VLAEVRRFVDYSAASRELSEQLGSWRAPDLPPSGWDSDALTCMEALVATWGRPEWEQASRVVERAERQARHDAELAEGAERALDLVKGLRRVAVTMLPDQTARQVLQRLGLPLGLVVARSSERRLLPAPDQLERALQRVGVGAGAAVMVGDSPWEAAAAVSANVPFIGVDPRGGGFPSGITVAKAVDEAVAMALEG
jgi:phosphoglycolate phosphatase-like HAD superfamily hydrolase